MNRNEKIIAGILFVVLLGWLYYQDQQARERVQERRDEPREDVAAPAEPIAPEADEPPLPEVPALEPKPADPEQEEAPLPPEREPEQRVSIANDVLRLTLSSHSGAIAAVELKDYRETADPESAPVQFDFSDHPALGMLDMNDAPLAHAFTLTPGGDGDTLLVEARTPDGLRFRRTVSIEDEYRVRVEDVFLNESEQPRTLPRHGVALGPMSMIQSQARARGQSQLELNTLDYRSGSRVERWRENDFAELFGVRAPAMGCGRPPLALDLPETAATARPAPLLWGAAKNKFFVQILAPEGGSAGVKIRAGRDLEAAELAIEHVSLDLLFSDAILEPGTEIRREMSYYIGPNKFEKLQELGQHQDQVMLHAWRGFGWFRSLSIGLLWLLNRLYGVIGNYGVAIILLTVLVRIVFWPVTRKSTANMKKMQDIQPLMKEIKEKHKDNPQKMQQETWALYRRHKVNPMTSCLPMLLQMPVFIALFNVLRSAVELRFASFLWIQDLSEPEGLLEGQLPFGLALNILPILMAVTTFLQQKLTPSAGDPSQRRMMMFMPVFMLFILYNFPSALALYWTVSNALAIGQAMKQRQQTG